MLEDGIVGNDENAVHDDGPCPNEIWLHVLSGQQPSLFASLSSSWADIRKNLGLGLKPLLRSVGGSSAGLLAAWPAVDWPAVFRPLREALPANWPDAPDWEAALEIMNDGIPLMWIPREEIVTALMGAADGAARRDLLVRRTAEIAADCQAALAEVDAAELLPLAGLASDACRALSAGHQAAAQALSANVFDTWLRAAARRGVRISLPADGWFSYGKVRGLLEPLSGDITIRELRAEGSLAPALMALASYGPGDTVPAEFSRHATAHAAGPEQYSDANAVIALMLATSVLRQTQASGW
jgi:hypothetical protein